jgi:hypothetical protein
MNMEFKKDVYVVLGVARSGTSAISGGLNALGINFGNQLLAGDSRNPKGFFEDTDILYNTNRGLLYHLDYSPLMDLNILDEKTSENTDVINQYKKYATNILKSRLKEAETFAFKAPCTLTLMSFWHDVFERANVNDKYVITVRHPLASAHSFHKWVRYDVEVGVLLWMRHLIHAINHTAGKKRVVVCYELMLEDARIQLQRIHQQLEVRLPFDTHSVNEYAEHFIDKNLRHHRFTTEDLKKHAALAVAPLCLELYDVLMKLAQDQLQFDTPEFAEVWQHINVEFAKLAPIYSYIDTLLRKNKVYERRFRSLERSLLWKLIYPLRMVDDVIRKLRKKSKALGRLAKIYE